MGSIWELDFYSRPILDETNKKLWEVVVCESPSELDRSVESLFRYSQFCSSKQVNSVWLRQALEEAISQAPKPPSRIRFFRRQMNNMITKACKDIGITAVPSRRTIALNQWLQQRETDVYPNEPGFDSKAATKTSTSVRYQPLAPQPLPDALIGQKWAFVSLEAGAFEEMSEWDISFGEAFPLQMLGLAPETPIPGLIIFSSRALPMAGWMSGIELAFWKVSSESPGRLILETGAVESWVLANLSDKKTLQEAREFEKAKEKAQQVHFLAVQSDPQSEAFAGFWLLQELQLS